MNPFQNLFDKQKPTVQQEQPRSYGWRVDSSIEWANDQGERGRQTGSSCARFQDGPQETSSRHCAGFGDRIQKSRSRRGWHRSSPVPTRTVPAPGTKD